MPWDAHWDQSQTIPAHCPYDIKRKEFLPLLHRSADVSNTLVAPWDIFVSIQKYFHETLANNIQRKFGNYCITTFLTTIWQWLSETAQTLHDKSSGVWGGDRLPSPSLERRLDPAWFDIKLQRCIDLQVLTNYIHDIYWKIFYKLNIFKFELLCMDLIFCVQSITTTRTFSQLCEKTQESMWK